jgi:hypothetical protein
MKLYFLLLSILFITSNAQAYPTYIRLNYTSCLACHQSVQGGGPLTAYGKGIANAESYLGGEYKPAAPKMMEHYVEARVMALEKLYNVEGKKTRIFPMQLDYSNIVTWRKDLRQEISFSVAPPSASKTSWMERVYLGAFKLDYALDKNNHIVVGGDHLPIGIRFVDHTSYVRERNRLGVNDVPVQAQYFHLSKDWQQTYVLYGPNPGDAINNREYGVASKQEVFVKTNWALGSDLLFSKGKSIDRDLLGIFTRYGTGPWSVMAQMDYTQRNLVSSNIKFDQWTSLLEGDYFNKDSSIYPTILFMISENKKNLEEAFGHSIFL